VFERRAFRFLLEALFLVALAIALAFAELRPLAILGVMALGWLLVAIGEWAVWRNEPHFGRGLPPRYHIPQVSLPPRRPLEQIGSGYPAAVQRDDAPTWIAPAALRAELLADWPVAAPGEDEDTETDLDLEPELEPAPNPAPVVAEGVVSLVEVVQDGPEPAVGLEPVPVVEAEPAHEPVPSNGPMPAPLAESAPESELPPADADLPALSEEIAVTTARHHLDPLEEPAKRRLWRRAADSRAAVEVPARPPRILPRRLK
jgi:hypothetical protein